MYSENRVKWRQLIHGVANSTQLNSSLLKHGTPMAKRDTGK